MYNYNYKYKYGYQYIYNYEIRYIIIKIYNGIEVNNCICIVMYNHSQSQCIEQNKDYQQ